MKASLLALTKSIYCINIVETISWGRFPNIFIEILTKTRHCRANTDLRIVLINGGTLFTDWTGPGKWKAP